MKIGYIIHFVLIFFLASSIRCEAEKESISVSEQAKTRLAQSSQPMAEGSETEILEYMDQGMNLFKVGKFHDAIRIWEQGIDVATQFNKKNALAAFHGNIGLAYHNLKQYDQAIDHYNRSAGFHKDIGNLRGQSGILVKMGASYLKSGDYSKSLAISQNALEISREAGDFLNESLAFYQMGQVQFAQNQFPEALKSFEASLDAAQKLEDKKREADTLDKIGLCHYYLGEYTSSKARYENALALHREIGDEHGEALSLANLGLVYGQSGQHHKAVQASEAALVIHRKRNETTAEGATLINLGLAQENLSHYQDALTNYEYAVKIHQSIGDRKREGMALNKLGGVYFKLGRNDLAMVTCQKALKIAKDIQDIEDEAGALNNLGLIYENIGEYENALTMFEKSMRLNREAGYNKGEGMLSNKCRVYLKLGQHEQALACFNIAFDADRATGDIAGQGIDLANIGAVYGEMGQWAKALGYYEQALLLRKDIGDREGQAVTLIAIGVVYTSLRKYELAMSYYEKALPLVKELENRSIEGTLLLNIGIVYIKLRQHEKAYRALSDSLSIARQINDPELLWRGQGAMAETEHKLGSYENAIMLYQESLDTIESLRASLSEKETKTSFMQNKLVIYDGYIKLLHQLHMNDTGMGYDRRALEIFERKQGRMFLEEIGKSGARRFSGLPDDVKAKEEAIESEIESVISALSKERSQPAAQWDHARIESLKAELSELRSRKETLERDIQGKFPDYYALKYPQPVPLDAIQTSVLMPGDAMLIYGVMEDETLLWVVTRDKFQMVYLPIPEIMLNEKITEFRKMIGVGTGMVRGIEIKSTVKEDRPLDQAAHELFLTLLPEEARSVLAGSKRVYIVPTGSLYALPFETLISKPITRGSPHYLIEDHTIIYLSSASLLNILKEAESRKQKTNRFPFLAFANPIYEDGQQTEEAAFVDSIVGLHSRAYRSIFSGSVFAPLPETEQEAKEVAAILNVHPESDSLQLGIKASKANVFEFNRQKRLDDYRFILFATHGVLPGEIDRITQPALVLSYPDKDGFLTMSDVFGLQLNAQLVSLSACNTAMGASIKGEGVVGLTRSFMYAGTPTVAVTLWSVESYSAMKMSTGLFRNIEKTGNTAESLRLTKLEMIRGKEGEDYRHPFYWAPMIIFGYGEK